MVIMAIIMAITVTNTENIQYPRHCMKDFANTSFHPLNGASFGQSLSSRDKGVTAQNETACLGRLLPKFVVN